MWTDEAALDAVRRRVDDWESTVAERATRTTALTRELAALTATARSPDGAVEATVDAAGALVDLRLGERVRGQPAARTADQVLATARAAQAELARRAVAMTEAALGADDPAARALVESYARRLRRPDGGVAGAAR
ncbi:YbaB/EbfC family nucleoid-associated protein [Micromonospora sp. C28SCA-DRY-2]|uniref:YbaB/EbfC family nucleoid-associated protein n=1 Tax=Micromonospora sp. C28SCA-DRY-2 TaxID=3059522 RepID=UPI00267478E7|nr:YbaB/EbfC family nucleoid-associated protein [Micromonospora sp. C28SCA-DRY-2]MDO3705003.1 YbaB/EbfC family nucleoid-associated protein [Micromonospora sp. C28SCA-DRY-2]